MILSLISISPSALSLYTLSDSVSLCLCLPLSLSLSLPFLLSISLCLSATVPSSTTPHPLPRLSLERFDTFVFINARSKYLFVFFVFKYFPLFFLSYLLIQARRNDQTSQNDELTLITESANITRDALVASACRVITLVAPTGGAAGFLTVQAEGTAETLW